MVKDKVCIQWYRKNTTIFVHISPFCSVDLTGTGHEVRITEHTFFLFLHSARVVLQSYRIVPFVS